MRWFFVFFFVSGFCSILYEIIWLRLAMSQFGVTSALVSIVLSMFMAGLGLGSWASGSLIRRYESRLHIPALRLYAITELLIGISAIVVPYELHWGRSLLEQTSLSSSWSYYLASGTWVASASTDSSRRLCVMTPPVLTPADSPTKWIWTVVEIVWVMLIAQKSIWVTVPFTG